MEAQIFIWAFFISFKMKKIVILFTSLLLLSCSSDDNVNSTPIPTGSDTVTFSFDGENFSTINSNINLEKLHISVYPFGGGSLIIFRLSNNEKAVEISIGSEYSFEEGKSYPINARQTANVSGRITYYAINSATKWASTNNEIGGTITIVKLDYENKIVAATFEFDAVEDDGTVHTIRNGWFDLKF